MIAQVSISAEHNLVEIVKLAGLSIDENVLSNKHWYDSGVLYVREVSQQDLDDAVSHYMANLDSLLLQPCRQDKIEEIARKAAAFVEGRYPSFRLMMFQALSAEAVAQGLTNRANYITSLLSWVKLVTASTIAVENDIDNALSVEEIENIELDLSAFINTDPQVTIKQALSIPD